MMEAVQKAAYPLGGERAPPRLAIYGRNYRIQAPPIIALPVNLPRINSRDLGLNYNHPAAVK